MHRKEVVALAVKLGRGNPARGTGTALILATNPDLHIRGELARQIVPISGPLLTIYALQQAPKPLGSIVRLRVPTLSYRDIYCAVAYPVTAQEAATLSWDKIEDTLVRALELAQHDEHQDVTVAFFFDAPYLHAALESSRVRDMMLRAGELFPEMSICILCWEDHQYVEQKEPEEEATPSKKPGRRRKEVSANADS